ncbi:hypothetical protein D3C71_1322420 [compost metagenome]
MAAVDGDRAVVDIDLERFAVFRAGVAPFLLHADAAQLAAQQFFDVLLLLGRQVRGGTPTACCRRTFPDLRLVVHACRPWCSNREIYRIRSPNCQKSPLLRASYFVLKAKHFSMSINSI